MSAPWKTYGEWGREETHWEQCFVWGFGEMTVSTLLDDALWEEGHVTFLTVVSLILRAAPGVTQACQCIANDWISEWTNECEDSKSVVLFLGVSDAMPQRLGTARLCCSVTQSCLTLCNTMDCNTPGFLLFHHLLELAQTHVHWDGDAIQPSYILPSPSPAFNPSQHQGLFQWVSSSHQVAKVWVSTLASVLPMSIQGWFPFGWTVQGTLKSFLQHHSSKASILWRSAFFIVQLSHPYLTTGKTIALTRWILVSKVMSLRFNMLFRLVITFLPRSKRLLISWLQSPSAVIWEPPKIMSVTVSIQC